MRQCEKELDKLIEEHNDDLILYGFCRYYARNNKQCPVCLLKGEEQNESAND